MRPQIRSELLGILGQHAGGATQTQIVEALGAACPMPLVLDSYLRELIREGEASRDGSVYSAIGRAAPASAAATKTTKTCTRCQIEKPLDDFDRHPNTRLGRNSQCKACVAAANKARRSGIAAPRPGEAAAPAARAAVPPEKAAAGGGNQINGADAMDVEVTKKLCLRCKVAKPLDEFHKHALGKLGRDTKCKACKSIVAKEIRKAAALPLADVKSKRQNSSAPRAVEATPPSGCEPAAGKPSLIMAPGFGFEASIVDGGLALNQYNSEGNCDTVLLSRTEARVLFAEFEEWVRA